jgi:NitT/TauT family transport system substrate-binding protein
MKTAHRLTICGAIALALLAVGPGAISTSVAQPRATIQLGWVDQSVHYLPFYLARERFFAEEGLDVQVSPFQGGAQAQAALVGGSVDVVVTMLETAISAVQAGHPVRIFYLSHLAMGVSWFGRSGITTWPDLRGRTVGISSLGSSTDSLTRLALRQRGLTPGTDVNLVQLGGAGVRLTALQAGRVDAAILVPPFTYMAERLGLPRLGTQQAEIGELWPQVVFSARERVLTERTDALRGLLRAYVRGVRRAQADREASVEQLMTWTKYSRADAEAVWAEAQPTFTERGDPPAGPMALFWQVMAMTGETTDPLPESRFLDRRLIDTFSTWAPPR